MGLGSQGSSQYGTQARLALERPLDRKVIDARGFLQAFDAFLLERSREPNHGIRSSGAGK